MQIFTALTSCLRPHYRMPLVMVNVTHPTPRRRSPLKQRALIEKFHKMITWPFQNMVPDTMLELTPIHERWLPLYAEGQRDPFNP